MSHHSCLAPPTIASILASPAYIAPFSGCGFCFHLRTEYAPFHIDTSLFAYVFPTHVFLKFFKTHFKKQFLFYYFLKSFLAILSDFETFNHRIL